MYEISYLFFYRPVFMFELLAASLLFLVYLKPRRGFGWRAAACVAACFAFSFAMPVVSYDAIYCSVLFLAMFAFSVAAWCFVFDERVLTVVFCCIAGYTVQHIAHEICELLLLAFNAGGAMASGVYSSANPFFGDDWLSVFLYIADMHVFAAVYAFFHIVAKRRMRGNVSIRLKASTMAPLVAFMLLLNVFFSALGIYTLTEDMNAVGQILIHVFNIASCIAAMIVLFEIPRRKKAEMELVMLEKLYKRGEMQYREAKENHEQMNMKYHDIKHLLGTLKERRAADDEIAQISKLVGSYENTYSTASYALNVVLGEKSAVCRGNGIDFSCIADASRLGFMSETDIYVLFGNILDNAIEAVLALPEGERTIGMLLKNSGELVYVTVYNGFGGELRFDRGLPVTTKADADSHGYGLKSVKRITEKYDGEMHLSAKNGIFELSLVFQSVAE